METEMPNAFTITNSHGIQIDFECHVEYWTAMVEGLPVICSEEVARQAWKQKCDAEAALKAFVTLAIKTLHL